MALLLLLLFDPGTSHPEPAGLFAWPRFCTSQLTRMAEPLGVLQLSTVNPPRR